jgi:hypothetical protein
MASRYWVGGSGSWSNTARWSATSGGGSGASVPGSGDNVFFDANSNVGTGAFAVTVAGTSNCADFTVSGLDGAMTFMGTSALNVFGSMTLQSTNLSVSGYTGTLTFAATTTGKTITSAGQSWATQINFSGVGGGWTLQDAFTNNASGTNTTSLVNGALALGSNTLTTWIMDTSGSSTRSINFGTGKIVVTSGNNGTTSAWSFGTLVGFSLSGTPNVDLTYSGSAGTRYIIHGSTAGSESNAISFNVKAGSDNVQFQNSGGLVSGALLSLDFTGFSGTFGPISQSYTLYGGLTLASAMTISNGIIITFASTSATTRVLTSNTKSFPSTTSVIFDGVGGTFQFGDNFTFSGPLTLNNGTLDLNGKTVTNSGITIGAGTKNITFNAGTLSMGGSFLNSNPTNFTTTAGTGTGKISFTSSSTFSGGGSTYNCTISNDSLTLTISGSNTITTLANGVTPTTIRFTAGTTQTITNFNLLGTAGNLVTINSPTIGSQFTLSKASGMVNADYLSIKDSNATGGAVWNAGANSVSVNNNTGWIFSSTAGFFLVM